MQYSTIAAPATPDTSAPEELAQSLGVDDPTLVIALIAEVDAIFCAAEAPCRQQPTPPAIGCALRGPRCAGRSLEYPCRRPRRAPLRRMTPVQRSPPEAAAAWYLLHQG
ncbi:Uncharacterised protein [Mycobacteroides abscessus subsp. abscessus]|nr:Uncharacterised protein [Mycobacteroides abscessus subsp. abscessus]